MNKSDLATRQKILNAALKQFARRGYDGASVQEIVDAAKVTKPTLYYYFANKAALYKALVDSAHDERYRLMQEAVQRGDDLKTKLVEILTSLFDFLKSHRELMRLAFSTAFASRNELPERMDLCGKPKRNFEFIHSMIKTELAARRLNRRFSSEELAFGIHGLMNIYVMTSLLLPDCKPDRKTAENVVELFLSGAANR
jgi:AcrR family transcriptional regulator